METKTKKQQQSKTDAAAGARPGIRFAMAEPPVVKDTTTMPMPAAAGRPGLAHLALLEKKEEKEEKKEKGKGKEAVLPGPCEPVDMIPLKSHSWSSPTAKAIFDAEEELFFGGRWPPSTF